MHISEAFSLLKPVCDRVVKNPTKENLHDLEETFDKISSSELLQLQDYVMYPLELNLKRPNLKSEPRIYIINCIKKLINFTEINNVCKFYHLFTLSFLQLFEDKFCNMVANVSEELKLSVLQCATTLIMKCTDKVAAELYNKSNMPKLSQGIFMGVQIMQHEKSRSLRLASIEFLMAITRVDLVRDDYDTVWRPDIADMFMFIVPGILSGLHKVVIGDEKQGHRVTVLALRAWSRILVLVLEDILPEKSTGKIHFSAKVTERLDRSNTNHQKVFEKTKSSKPDGIMNEINKQKRNVEWAANVAENVNKMVNTLRPLQQHNHWKVRLELVEACRLILNKCHRHMKEASIVFVEILLKLSDDEVKQVAALSEAAVEHLAKKLEEENGVSLYDILEENFFGLITKLPRVFHVESDEEKHSALSLLKQYERLLGARGLPLLLQSAPLLERTLLALLQAAHLQAAHLSLLHDCSLRDLELNQDPAAQSSWKHFKHFADKSVLQKLEQVLRLLGKNGDLEVLCNYLLDMLHSGSEHRNEIIFILNEILLGGAGAEGTDHIVKNVLNTYLSQELWYVPLSASGAESIAAGEARANLQSACLLVEGVGCAARGLGARFRFFLVRTMYPVVERAGSAHAALAAAGLQAAAAVAAAVGQGDDITSLLAANMDYFMVQVTLRLRSLHHDAGVLGVLSVAMKHSSRAMLPHLQNAVADVLLKSCDSFQRNHTTSFLHVFYTFFICIKKWFVNPSEKSEESNASKAPDNPSEILEKLSQYCMDSCVSKGKEDLQNAEELYAESCSQREENECCEEDQEEEKKPEVPAHIKMTESILQRCLHMLPGKDRQCRLLALEALHEGLEVLADHEDQLLPVVHQVWAPLVGRLQDTGDALMLNRSFLLLATLGRLAKDFLRARTLKQVMSPLCRFLQEAALKSECKDSGSAFRYTQLFKLQLCLLEGLGPLAVHLQLQEKETYQLLSAAAPYLSARQPRPLQESCIKLLKTVAAYDGDAVWLEMVKIQREMTSRFKDNQEYVKNTEDVLQHLQDVEGMKGW